ncbi:MAG: HAD-IG family 5'-nucleotidase [Myxococcales bacterium]|nr:HAD-IG family 5'-nucleotidase [Myxococcales bacterium]
MPLVPPPPAGRGLYCNRTLNLRGIQIIGYDMDDTLVHYRVIDWERRAYEHLRARLAAAGWPVEDLEFDPELAVRGLIIDVDLGNVLKANRFGYVKVAQHGTVRMPYDQLRETYLRTIVDLASSRYDFANTLFALSECCMYAQLVDRLDAGTLVNTRRAPDEHLSYRELHRLVRRHLDATHMEGQLKAEIMANPERFVELEEDTVTTLLDQREAGKKLVLITNSGWIYTNAMMRYAFERFLPRGTRWQELFDVSIVAARKPSFFESDAPLLRVVDEAGRLEPHHGPLEPHGCYFGGHASVLEAHFRVKEDELLYLGDHMFGDVHVTKNVLRWRTGLILRELEEELEAVEAGQREQAELSRLMADKERLEYQQAHLRLAVQRSKLGRPSEPDAPLEALTAGLHALRRELEALDQRIGPLAARASEAMNPRWGLLMRAGNDKSQLARQIERYADFYTSRVSNLRYATPFAYLRSVRGSLPHDPRP